MITPSIPSHEGERLLALKEYGILDTLPESDFDDITKLAAHICGAPVSVISFIGESTAWLKSHYGVDENEIPRKFAFCSHAINTPNEIFMVPDSRLDKRFSDNPLVTGSLNLVFYAGMPLVNPQGYALGTICIVDNQPRTLTVEQEDALKTISKQIVKLLELRKKNLELAEKQSELERTLKLFTQISTVAKVGGWEMDIHNNKLNWTAVTKEIHDLPSDFEPDIQKAINYYKPGKCRDAIAGLVIDAIEYGKPFDQELQIITAKGKLKWVRVKGLSEFINNKCNSVYGIIQDINEDKLKELKLAQSEEEFRQTFDHATIGMALVNPMGKWLKVNKSTCEILGYDQQTLLETSFQDITHPEDLNEDLIILQKLLAGKIDSYEIEKRYIHKDGHTIWVILSVSLIRDSQNNPLHFVSQITDITTRKKAEQVVKEERLLLTTLMENLPLNVYIKDTKSRKILVNKKEIEHMGNLNRSDILGKTDYELYPEEIAAISMKEDEEVFASGKPIINKESCNIRNNDEQWFLTSKIPLLNEANEITGLLGISYDIFERKIAEKKLKEMVDVTSEQNVKLLNFAYIVSHNLRSHSSNFAMLLQFLEDEQNENEKQQLFAMLKKASGNLIETVAHLNEIAVVHYQTKSKSSINLSEAIKNVQSSIQALLLESNVEVINEVDESLVVSAVPAYIDSILLNLLTNGIKYKSPEKNPFVRFQASQIDGKLLLTIQDNGLGIDLERNRDKLFGMYKTFHGNKDARGVGLFITKNQVEAMGGTIDVESKVGGGTAFKIYLNLH